MMPPDKNVKFAEPAQIHGTHGNRLYFEALVYLFIHLFRFEARSPSPPPLLFDLARLGSASGGESTGDRRRPLLETNAPSHDTEESQFFSVDADTDSPDTIFAPGMSLSGPPEFSLSAQVIFLSSAPLGRSVVRGRRVTAVI